MRLQLIAERSIDVVLDAGANEGLFGVRLRAGGYRGRIVSFEPLSAAFAKLEQAAAADPRWECRQVALGAHAGRAVLNVAGNWASSSLLPMKRRLRKAEPRVAYVGTEECEVATLDDLRAEILQQQERAYLKLDVQGFELEVLRGAAATLEQVDVLDVELSLARLYDRAPLSDEVVHYLEERRFSLVETEPSFVHPKTKKTLQVDGLFVRISD
jgi:FkbM family methyltransferase